MVLKSQLAVAAALVAFGTAMPTKRSTNTLQQKSAGPRMNGQAAYVKALKKYKASPGVIAAAQAGDGSVTATPTANDEEYLCPITIGGSQTFNMDFDTGSSDLWVFGPSAGGPASYTPGSSATQEQGETWQISYGDGSSASGVIYDDTVAIGGTTVTGQAVEQATQASSEFTSGQADGLVGLAWDSINTASPNKVKTFLSNAISQGMKGAVTADLRKGEPGSYTFGDIPTNLISGDVTYTPVDNSQGFWSFTADSYAIGGTAGQSGSLTGIADTGTTLILLSSAAASEYWGQVSGSSQSNGAYNFPCSTTPPDFSLTVGGYTATVPGSYINYQDNGDGTCYGGIQDAGDIGFNIFGDVFLKSQVVVFDMDNTQLGLAAKA